MESRSTTHTIDASAPGRESGIVARATVRPAAPAPPGAEPLTFGVPAPRGRIVDVTRLAAVGDRPLPTDATVLERWDDGSARWILCDVHAEVGAAGLTLDIRDDVSRPSVAPLEVHRSGSRITVSGAPLSVTVDASDPRLVTRLNRGRRPGAVFDRSFVHLLDGRDREVPIAFSDLQLEHAGALRVVILATGRAALAEGASLVVEVRLTLLAGWPVVGVDLGLHNPRAARHDGGYWELGDPGSVLVRGLAVACTTPSNATRARLSPAPDRAVEELGLPLSVAQQGSGGPHWNSRTHVNRDGLVAVDGPGGRIRSAAVDREEGRLLPRLAVEHAGGALAVTSSRFWQVFPKAYDADATGRILVWSLPPGNHPHELQAGERCHHAWWLACLDSGDADETVRWCRQPSTVLPEPAAVAAAEHVAALSAIEPGTNDGYDALVGAAMDGPDTFLAKRERVDEYGWRHFGDLYADHENGTEPGRQIVSHYNNQYDAVQGLTLQALRHDDHRWWEQAHDLARHVARIDLYWTSEDRAAYNGGMFWHTAHYTDAGTSTHRCYPRNAGLPGGGPSNEQCYSTGLLWHHFLTGDALSRAAVVSLGEWMIAADDGRRARRPLPWLSTAPTGGASATVSPDYHGPGRGAANAVQALLNAARATGDARFVRKSEEILRRVIHPDDDPTAHTLLDAERRWSYTVLLQLLGRCLWARFGDDALQAYMRASLLRYARWMAEHEYCYLDKPEVLEFPTETWAAQDLRKAEIFDVAAYFAETAAERERFLERAQYFHARSIDTLLQSDTKTRTRPLVLLLHYGYTRPWYARHAPGAPLLPLAPPAWPPRRRFEPQRAIAVRRVKWLAAVATAAAVLSAILIATALRG
jgi:hypothetical protein